MPARLSDRLWFVGALGALTVLTRAGVLALLDGGAPFGVGAIAATEGVLAGLLVIASLVARRPSRAAHAALRAALWLSIVDAMIWIVGCAAVLVRVGSEQPGRWSAIATVVGAVALLRVAWVGVRAGVLAAGLRAAQGPEVARWLAAPRAPTTF